MKKHRDAQSGVFFLYPLSIQPSFNKKKPILCRFALANGLLKTNIKVRLNFDFKFSNLGRRIKRHFENNSYKFSRTT